MYENFIKICKKRKKTYRRSISVCQRSINAYRILYGRSTGIHQHLMGIYSSSYKRSYKRLSKHSCKRLWAFTGIYTDLHINIYQCLKNFSVKSCELCFCSHKNIFFTFQAKKTLAPMGTKTLRSRIFYNTKFYTSN